MRILILLILTIGAVFADGGQLTSIGETFNQILNTTWVKTVLKGSSACGAIYFGVYGSGLMSDRMDIKQILISFVLIFVWAKYNSIVATLVGFFS